MNCMPEDLGARCRQNGHSFFEHDPEIPQFHGFIEKILDVHVANLMEFGAEYIWHHTYIVYWVQQRAPLL